MKSLRSWATPLIIGAFLIMGVSGTLMFFHAETTLMKVIHEWAGWLMLVGAGAHVVLNWRAFTTYFKRPLATGIMSVSAALLALTVLPVGPNTGDIGQVDQLAMSAVMGGEIETLADLAGSDTETVLARLGAAGIEASATDTPQTIAGQDRMQMMEVVATIFAP